MRNATIVAGLIAVGLFRACPVTAQTGQDSGPRSFVLDRPMVIQVPFSEEVIRNVLLTEPGARWWPEGRIGNNQLLSDIVSEVRLYVPAPEPGSNGRSLIPGPHNQELAEEIIGLLRQAQNGTYVPPSRRQYSVNPVIPTSISGQNPGLAGRDPVQIPNRQDSTIMEDRFANPPASGQGFSQPQAGYPGGSSVLNNQPAGSLPPSGGHPGSFDPPAVAGGSMWAGTELRPPTLALPSTLPAQPQTEVTGVVPRPGMAWPGNEVQNQPAAAGNTVGWPNPSTGLAGSQPSQVGTQPMPPVSPALSQNDTAAILNEMRMLRDEIGRQQQQLLQQNHAVVRLTDENRQLQQQLTLAAGGNQTQGNQLMTSANPWGQDFQGSTAPPDRRTVSGNSAPSGLVAPAAINGPASSATGSLRAGEQSVSLAELEHVKRQNLLLWLFLAASIGLNIYLAMIARGLYVRYDDLADELRETFTAAA